MSACAMYSVYIYTYKTVCTEFSTLYDLFYILIVVYKNSKYIFKNLLNC